MSFSPRFLKPFPPGRRNIVLTAPVISAAFGEPDIYGLGSLESDFVLQAEPPALFFFT